MIETSGPTRQHASPHITDNYSFRSLPAPIARGAPRVSDTLSGSPIFYPRLCHFIKATPSRERLPSRVCLSFLLAVFPFALFRCPRFVSNRNRSRSDFRGEGGERRMEEEERIERSKEERRNWAGETSERK